MKKRFLYCLILIGCSFVFNVKAQDINGVWTGNFIQYIHNTYDVELTIEKLPPGDIFSARLRITDGYYFGEYSISGYICNKKNLEINTIVLIKENESGNWVDCLNGTFDLNEDGTELTFTDTWLEKDQKNNLCKIKYIQRDMFQCLRSAYLHKAKYLDAVAEFNKLWKENEQRQKNVPTAQIILSKKEIVEKDSSLKEDISPLTKSETKIVAKNEDRAPVIDIFEDIKARPVYVKDAIDVVSADIVIEYWDRYNEDGDSINLYLNKQPILQNQLLTKAKKSITVHLEKTKNYLVLDAVNLGKEPPNTASITVKDGKKIQNVSLTSTMKTSGALKITLRK